jgi:hypothetical protein
VLRARQPTPTRFNVIVNWFEEIRRLVPCS